jgi:hypothetical protein
LKRALVFLLLSCSKEAPKPTVDASVTAAPTTCEQGPWDEAARAKHHATAAKLSQRDAVMDKVVDQGTRALTKEERAVYFTKQMLSEVRHGGLHQYFTSSAGNCALQTRDALNELGHRGLVNLYARALERFPSSGPSEDRQARWKQLDAIPNAKNAWDETTQAMNRLDDVDAHIAKYAKAHVR